MGVRLSEKKPKRERRAEQASVPTTTAVAAVVHRASDILARSVRLHGLPPKTQEGLLQQALEKIVPLKKLEVFQDLGQATAELRSVAVSIVY